MFETIFLILFLQEMFMLLSMIINAHSGILFSGEMAAILDLEAILDLRK